MTPPRRTRGTGRLLREAQLLRLAEQDPERARALEELRAQNPQAFRKALLRLIRDGILSEGPER